MESPEINQTQEDRQISVPSKELVVILSTLQLASRRGVFRPEEFVEIGNAYQALYQFLVDIGVITPSNTASDQKSDATPD
jgi:hypothetical protein